MDLKNPLKEIHISRVISGLVEKTPFLVGIIPWEKYLERGVICKEQGNVIQVTPIDNESNIIIVDLIEEWKWKVGEFGNSVQIQATLHSNIRVHNRAFDCYKTSLPDPDNPATDIEVGIVLSNF